MNATLPTPAGSRTAYWVCQLAGWYLIAATQFGALASIAKFNLPAGASIADQAAFEMIRSALGGISLWLGALQLLALHTCALLLSHLLHAQINRRHWAALSGWAKVPRVLLAGLVLSTPLGWVQQYTEVAVLHAVPPGIPPWLAQLQQAIQWAPYFWAWMIIYFVILNQRRLRFSELHQSELARELQQAELRLLKAQLNPHFLFNSLNSVRALIAGDPARAQDAVTQLARTLRYTLASGHEELVTLAHELEIVTDYLELEALRLGHRLSIERDISAEALRARIPVMLLQTIVENAIKHGIAELSGGGVLRMSARVDSSLLKLTVENPRPAAAVANDHEGLGLRNSAERLRLLFGAAASLDLDLAQANHAVARICIPVQP